MVNCVYPFVIHHVVKEIVPHQMYAHVIVVMNQIGSVHAFQNVHTVVIMVIVLRQKNVNVVMDTYYKMHNVHQFVQSKNRNEKNAETDSLKCFFFFL